MGIEAGGGKFDVIDLWTPKRGGRRELISNP